MALEYKKVKDEIDNAPLNESELILLSKAENHIDDEIRKDFDGVNVRINLMVPTFEYDVSLETRLNLSLPRRKLMRNELEKRYKNAGWKITVSYDDGLDGPNMSGADLWILSGKR